MSATDVELISSTAEMRERAAHLRSEGKRIGFVPTMGALHEGHLSLVTAAAKRADVVVVSVFVNPTQFGPTEDFASYPRDIERDAALAEQSGCDILFVPTAREIYPDHYATVVHVQKLTQKMCGAFRPGHFDGVTTVVAKLLNIVRPHFAVFGQKDGQQVAVIERMVEDLDMDVDIVRVPTVREPDGLALSSRNAYLSTEERARATVLHEALRHALSLYRSGIVTVPRVLDEMQTIIRGKEGVELQYCVAVDSRTLEDVSELKAGVMIALAAFLGKTRLIDNVVLK